jgi:hypothetical protein
VPKAYRGRRKGRYPDASMARCTWVSVVLVFSAILAGCGGARSKSDAPTEAGGADAAAGSAARGGSPAGGGGGAAAGASSGQAGMSGGGTSCAFTTCGGDLVGRWQAESTCQDATSTATCPGQTFETTPTSDLIVTFDAHGTASVSAVTETVAISVPDSCAAMLGQASADAFCAMVESQSGMTQPGIHVSADCTVDAGVCHCDLVETIDASSTTYTVNGAQVTVGDAPAADFCVAGDRLMLRQPGNSGAAPVVTYARLSD